MTAPSAGRDHRSMSRSTRSAICAPSTPPRPARIAARSAGWPGRAPGEPERPRGQPRDRLGRSGLHGRARPGSRRQAWPRSRDRQTAGGQARLRPPAPPLGGGAILRMGNPLPKARQELRTIPPDPRRTPHPRLRYSEARPTPENRPRRAMTAFRRHLDAPCHRSVVRYRWWTKTASGSLRSGSSRMGSPRSRIRIRAPLGASWRAIAALLRPQLGGSGQRPSARRSYHPTRRLRPGGRCAGASSG